MTKYIILSDYEKSLKLRQIEEEKKRLRKSLYWILKKMDIPKSTYYDWKKTNGISKSKAPKTVWNKTPKWIEDKIVSLRKDASLYPSERSPLGIKTKLEKEGIFIHEGTASNVLKRNNLNRIFKDHKDPFLIYPKAERFFDVICIDDVSLTKQKPRDMSVFNAIDEYSYESVGILFANHRINRWDVIKLLDQIKKRYGRYPKILRLDNAKAHISNLVKTYCHIHNITLQFIDKGRPEQNWPVESFNKVLKRDLLLSPLWGSLNSDIQKQKILYDYTKYYNERKPVPSDPLRRTPREISSAITSLSTQTRLKLKLMRKKYGQVYAREAMIKEIQKHRKVHSLNLVSDLSEMCIE
ncbi:MAG: integrase core domain-containing protein [Candidatus Pacebacteria bacterium]|nr:integrase core domain-containing protein [Candidatus Paceibacterota bacterium]